MQLGFYYGHVFVCPCVCHAGIVLERLISSIRTFDHGMCTVAECDVKAAFHDSDIDTDTDILARILARM